MAIGGSHALAQSNSLNDKGPSAIAVSCDNIGKLSLLMALAVLCTH